jgi:diguanylate cyclase (GGDEF)-like protein/PAS domain S-box-containing protein
MARVLVVDDVAVNRELVATLLRYAGHELAEARDGEDALARTRAFRPDLVVCDILMPRMDGYEFVRRLRDEPAIAGTAIIFYTASFLEKEARMLAYACGVLNVLTKPCEPQEILAAVASALAAGGPTPPAPHAVPEFDRDHLRLVTDKLAQKAQELERANDRLAALIDLGVRLASEHETTALLDHFCDGVRRLFRARLVLLLAREADGSAEMHLVVNGDAGNWSDAIRRLQAELAQESGATAACRFDAAGGDAALRAKVLRHCPDARCALLAPVVSLRSHYGWILLVDQLETCSFNADDQRTLAVQAAQVGRFYENGNLYAQVQQQVGLLRAQADAREREAVLLRLEHDVARALVAAETTDSALTTVLQAICESQQWDVGRFWQVDPAADVLRLAVQWLAPSVELASIGAARIAVLKPGEGLAGRVWRTGEPLFVADLRAEPRLVERAVLQLDGLACATLFPLGSGGRVFGVLSFLGRHAREPDQRMQASARVIGDQIGQFLQRRDAQDAVKASKKFIRSTLDSLLEHVCVIDSTGVVLTVNRAWRAFAQVHGVESVRAMEGSNYLDACANAHGEEAREARAMADGIRRVIQGLQPTFTMEYACDMPEQAAWFVARVSRFADDGPVRVVVAHENITERKQAEQRIQRLHRVSTVMSDINALILRVKERDELFKGACRIAIDTGSFKMAWVGVLSGEPLRVEVVAGENDGSTSGYFDNLREELQTHVTTNSPQFRQLVVQQQPIVVNDIAATPWMALREASLLAGARSAIALPLVVGTVTRGLIMLYADDADFFDDDEIKLLRQLAGDLSFAMNHLHQAEQLNHLAYYDALTGHANGMLFGERVTQFLEAARGTRLAIGVVDIERFKAINDVWGRHAGDDLLRQVAARLLGAVGERSRLARVGPDQYGVVIQNAPQGIELLRTLNDLYKACFGEAFTCGGTAMHVAAHVGVALYPDDGADADTLFRNAEAAVKRTKRSPHRVLLYDAQVGKAIAEKIALEMRLREALDAQRFVLHYQPKVDARTRRIVGAEALIRWQDPELGLVPPVKFIPLMEETGLIVEVGAWALRQAVQDRLGWIARGLVAPNVAVNVSAVQLRKGDFVDAVLAVLGDAGGQAGIDLEITESAAMEDVDDTIAKLERLRAHGIVLAIDDFGTGYSSLAYLSKLPAQVLKIDRAFVSTMNADANAMTLVATMVSLAHAMRMEVVAEGVETQQQADTLCAMQCDQLQGYLISRPLPEPVFALLLEVAPTPPDEGA